MRPSDIPLREVPVQLGGPTRLCAAAPCCAGIVPSASARCDGGACGTSRVLAGAARLAVGCFALCRPRVLDSLAEPASTLVLRSGLKSVVSWRLMTHNTANMIGHASPTTYRHAVSGPCFAVRIHLRAASTRRQSASAYVQSKPDQDSVQIHVRLGGARRDGQPIPSARAVDSAVECPWPRRCIVVDRAEVGVLVECSGLPVTQSV